MWPKTIAYPFQGSVSSSLRMVTMESTSQSCGTEGANVCQAPVSMPRTWYVIPLQGHVSYVKVWTQTHCLCKVNTQKYPWLHKEIFPVLFFLKHKTCLSSFSFSTLEALVKEVFCFLFPMGKITVQLYWWNSTGPWPWSERVFWGESCRAWCRTWKA